MSFLCPPSEKIRSFQTKNYEKQVLPWLWTDLPYTWENNFPHDLKVKETAVWIPRNSDKSCRIQWHSSSFMYFILPWAQFQSSACASGRRLDKRTPGVLSNLNYLMILCSGSSLQRHCYILTVSYLQTQGALQSRVLSPFWDESWGQSTVSLPFLSSLLSFLHSMWEDTCVNSWKGCIRWADLWCEGNQALIWMIRRHGRLPLLQLGYYGFWVCDWAHIRWGRES